MACAATGIRAFIAGLAVCRRVGMKALAASPIQSDWRQHESGANP
jgi:hypothetical protein